MYMFIHPSLCLSVEDLLCNIATRKPHSKDGESSKKCITIISSEKCMFIYLYLCVSVESRLIYNIATRKNTFKSYFKKKL